MPAFGKKSTEHLKTAHEIPRELCSRVVEHFDITILDCFRDEEKQNRAHKIGASTKRWPDSIHNKYPSMAVDAAPYPIPEGWGDLKGQTLHARDLNWKERVKFYEMIAVFEFCWEQLLDDVPELRKKYRLRSGKDWDGDGDYRDQTFDDLPHIEIIEIK